MSEETPKSVRISKRLFDRIQEKIKNTSFSSPSDYVSYVLEKELNEADYEEAFSEEDEKKVKERLRSLGYL